MTNEHRIENEIMFEKCHFCGTFNYCILAPWTEGKSTGHFWTCSGCLDRDAHEDLFWDLREFINETQAGEEILPF